MKKTFITNSGVGNESIKNKNHPIDTGMIIHYSVYRGGFMIDYSRYTRSDRYYGGAEQKRALLIDGRHYFVKFQKNSRDGFRYNHISEYLGSHIFNMLDINAQETFLGKYNGSNVVVIKDFLGDDEVFVPFNGVGDSSLESGMSRFSYDYEDIIKMLQKNIKLTKVEESIDIFWNMFIVDAFIANFDRHGSNWGFIKKNNKYRMAPIFDNGSCLFPQLNTDDKIKKVLSDREEISKRIYSFPTSQIRHNGEKSSYYDIINSLQFEECNKALIRIMSKINLSKVEKLINEIEQLSDIRAEFYKTILNERYEKILLDSYNKLGGF